MGFVGSRNGKTQIYELTVLVKNTLNLIKNLFQTKNMCLPFTIYHQIFSLKKGLKNEFSLGRPQKAFNA